MFLFRSISTAPSDFRGGYDCRLDFSGHGKVSQLRRVRGLVVNTNRLRSWNDLTRSAQNKQSNQHEYDYGKDGSILFPSLLLSAIIFTHNGSVTYAHGIGKQHEVRIK